MSYHGFSLTVPADHHLQYIHPSTPLFSMPLVDAVSAIDGQAIVVDVGANVGDTALLVESECPGRCRFLCIEADANFARLCRLNLAPLGTRATVVEAFVGSGSRVAIKHREPGTATTVTTEAGQRSISLDELCQEPPGIIKIDTDGFDFPILLSSERILHEYHPLLLFEWTPSLWSQAGYDPMAVFPWLTACGYRTFAFFTGDGFFHTVTNDISAIRYLCGLANSKPGTLYFDILASPSEDLCERAITANLERMSALRGISWTRMQPSYWD